MKLLLCRKCSDVFSLYATEESRTCKCGACGGRYVNHVDAEVTGQKDQFFVLGFANGSLVSALRAQLYAGDSDEVMTGAYAGHKKGRGFEAFIVPESSPTVRRIYTDVQ